MPRPPRVAVCYLAFDRHHLVRLTLRRVRRFLPAGWALRVWQDGAAERCSGRIVGSASRISRNLKLFNTAGVEVSCNAANEGPARNYWAAERWAFEEIGADFCIFIEDDIVISRHFLPTMAVLGRLALNDRRIGAFSAFGDASIGWLEQFRNRNRLQPMHHRWGYGITRDYWLRSRRDYQDYLGLLGATDYRNRPSAAIVEWLSGLTDARAISHITSQDGARTAIMLKLGCFSIMTTPSFAVNIGKSGIHFSPDFYRRNQAQVKGPGAFFPLPCVSLTSLPEAAAAALHGASRGLAYW